MSSFESSTYVSEQDAMTAPPLRLLSLDGGGIRGLSELIILDEIMNCLKYALKSPVDLLPADYFDMICGTNTGGLIVLLLERLRFSTAKAIRCYASLGKEIFKNKRSKSWHGYSFESSNMERAIKNLLEVKYGHGHGDDRMLADEEESRHSCKAFVCAVNSSHMEGDPTKFRTWSVAKDRSLNCKIWEAARATCAAPRFFQSIFIEENGIDKDPNSHKRGLFSCILSIGAGIPKALGFTRPKSLKEKVAPMSLADVLKGMATSTEKEAAEMEKKYGNIPGVYHRINVGRDIGDIGLEELEELGQVASHTRAYLRKDGISRQIDGIVAALAHKTQPGIRLHQLGSNHITLPSVTQHICFPRSQADRHGFVPRSCMHEIDYMFNDVLLKRSSKTIVLQGMGVSQGGFNAVLWVDGTAKTSVEQSFSRIADSIIRKSLEAVDIKSFPALVRNQIETWKELWLLVFDNFDDPADYDIKEYLPQSDFGLIIVTGRHPAANDLGYYISIGDLLEEEAMNLLFHRTNQERTHENIEDARKICCHLSCLALAVDQAGAYIKSTGIDLSPFIEHFNKQQNNIMAWSLPLKTYKRLDPPAPDQEITLTVSTTWELSYNRISGSKEINEAKRHFLLVSAFLMAIA
ncbi:uncharacterized protein EAF02_005557 [Botrytis sinoallii]|uniref:uncharacterized protein n=1 Tax=Botrytis sinoallii TaxID=1463999 RepID=UPI0018FF2F89|nr:uncharacterized protein EAF02_005557 [Botrytis sinoallii]KAF7883637.1 hypothetical protein EAF02_005557 [Botrytis sinoallii]